MCRCTHSSIWAPSSCTYIEGWQGRSSAGRDQHALGHATLIIGPLYKGDICGQNQGHEWLAFYVQNHQVQVMAMYRLVSSANKTVVTPWRWAENCWQCSDTCCWGGIRTTDKPQSKPKMWSVMSQEYVIIECVKGLQCVEEDDPDNRTLVKGRIPVTI